ncbi:MAG: RDD family protein [Actinomycetota bacterium]|nr:RDD family protein [Actinomycetota bacterium]
MSGTIPPERPGPDPGERSGPPAQAGDRWSSPGETSQGPGVGNGASPPPPPEPGVDDGRATTRDMPAGRIADVGRRVSADLVDFLVLALLGVAAGFVLRLLGFDEVVAQGAQGQPPSRFGFPRTLATLVHLIVHLAYWTLMEGTGGQSVGKLAFGIRALREDSSPLDYSTALKRHVLFYLPQVLGLVPSLVVLVLAATVQGALVLAGLVTYVLDQPLRQGFHDKFAGTIVVRA